MLAHSQPKHYLGVARPSHIHPMTAGPTPVGPLGITFGDVSYAAIGKLMKTWRHPTLSFTPNDHYADTDPWMTTFMDVELDKVVDLILL